MKKKELLYPKNYTNLVIESIKNNEGLSICTFCEYVVITYCGKILEQLLKVLGQLARAHRSVIFIGA